MQTFKKPYHAAAQVETSHIGKRAYKVKGLTEKGASQMTFFNKCAQRLCASTCFVIAGEKSLIPDACDMAQRTVGSLLARLNRDGGIHLH